MKVWTEMSVFEQKRNTAILRKAQKMNRMSQPRLTTWYLNMKAGYMKARGYIAQGIGQELEALAWRLAVASIPREVAREEA